MHSILYGCSYHYFVEVSKHLCMIWSDMDNVLSHISNVPMLSAKSTCNTWPTCTFLIHMLLCINLESNIKPILQRQWVVGGPTVHNECHLRPVYGILLCTDLTSITQIILVFKSLIRNYNWIIFGFGLQLTPLTIMLFITG